MRSLMDVKQRLGGLAAVLAVTLTVAACGPATPTESGTSSTTTTTTTTTTTEATTTEATTTESTTTEVTTTEGTTEGSTEPSISVTDTPSSDLPTTDRAGNPLELAAAADTVAVMAPAYAQILEDLGAADRIVAVDSNTPATSPELAELPQMDLFAPNAEMLIELSPSLVLASSISMAGGDDSPFAQVAEAGIPVAYLPTPDTLAEIAEDVRFIGQVMGLSAEGDALADTYLANIRTLEAAVADLTERPTALFEVAPAPEIYSFGSGTYLNEMMATVGIDNILADQTGWLPVTEEAVLASDPTVIFTAADWLEDPVQEILDRPAWAEVAAVKDGNVYFIANELTQLPSHRVVDGMLEMGRAVHGDRFDDVTLD